MSNIPNNRRLILLAGCAVVALALPLAPGALAPAQAASCGLSLDDNNATINTVGGADSDSIDLRLACGFLAMATGANSTAVGAAAAATSFNSTAFGTGAEATGSTASAFGASTGAAGMGSTAVGYGAGFSSGTAQGYTALGTWTGTNHALGLFSTTIGGSNGNVNNSRATGDYSIAIGGGGAADTAGAIAGGANGNDFTIAIGTGAQAGATASGQTGAVAVGTNALANAIGAVAFGQNSLASGSNSAAYGRQSRAFGNNSAVYGLRSLASGGASVAIGFRAEASHNHAVAIGSNSVTDAANSVSVGSASVKRRIRNVASGVAANDAVTVAQLQAAVAAVASGATPTTIAVPIASEPPAVSVVRVGDAWHGVEDMRRELAELRALVREQQQRLAQLESRVVAAAK